MQDLGDATHYSVGLGEWFRVGRHGMLFRWLNGGWQRTSVEKTTLLTREEYEDYRHRGQIRKEQQAARERRKREARSAAACDVVQQLKLEGSAETSAMGAEQP